MFTFTADRSSINDAKELNLQIEMGAVELYTVSKSPHFERYFMNHSSALDFQISLIGEPR